MPRSFTAFLISGLLLMSWPLSSFAHAHLARTIPDKDSVLSIPPETVQLWFSEDVQGEWSKIEVTDANGNRVDKEFITGNDQDHTLLQIDLFDLESGTYNVNWSTLSHDGHRSKGTFSFTVQ